MKDHNYVIMVIVFIMIRNFKATDFLLSKFSFSYFKVTNIINCLFQNRAYICNYGLQESKFNRQLQINLKTTS